MRQGVRGIIIRDDHLLVMERHNKGEHYFALVGGSVDPGETHEQALVRELREETGLVISSYRHVYTEVLEPYGAQYVYLVDDPGGDVALSTDSIEAKLNAEGQNMFTPTWIALSDLSALPLMSPKMKAAILTAVKNTFPKDPISL